VIVVSSQRLRVCLAFEENRVTSGEQPEFSPQLYDDLRQHLRGHDQDRAIGLIYQLLASGRPLGEVVAEVVRPVEAPPGDDGGLAPMPPAPFGLLIDRAGRVTADRLAQHHDAAAGEQIDRGPIAAAAAAAAHPGSTRPAPERRRRWAAGLAGLYVVAALAVAVAGVLVADRTGTTGAVLNESRASAPGREATAPAAETDGPDLLAVAAVATEPPEEPATAPRPAITDAAGGEAAPLAQAAAAAGPAVPIPAAVAGNGRPALGPEIVAAAIALAAPVEPPAAAAAVPSSLATAPPAAAPAEPRLSAIEIAALMSRGDALFIAGDLTSARLFYRYGADAGDGVAALRLGETFDPDFLQRARLALAPGDPGKAAYWYRRARDLGNHDAEILLQHLEPTGN
jgi:hypothetical protein